MPETNKILVGLGGSVAVCVAWELYPQKTQYKLAKLAGSPLAVFEHYHWGLMSLIAGRYVKSASPYLYGLGAGLIVAECAQPEPFAVAEPYFGASTAIGIALATILVLSCG